MDSSDRFILCLLGLIFVLALVFGAFSAGLVCGYEHARLEAMERAQQTITETETE